MARARNIKPGFYENEELGACTMAARLLYPALWQMACREGRLEDRPLRIKGYAFRYDSVDVEPLLVELEQHGFIVRYVVGGVPFIQILRFRKHQNPHHREPPSTIPPPPQSPGPAPLSNPVGPEAHGGSQPPQAQGDAGLPSRVLATRGDLAGAASRAESLFSDSGFPESLASASHPSDESAGAAKPKRVSSRHQPDKLGKTVPTWEAYRQAFKARHGEEPIRSAAVNGQLAHFVSAVGLEEAPKVAAFYLKSNEPFYVNQLHPVHVMLRDAQKLRTLWRTNGAVSDVGLRTDYSAGIDAAGKVLP
ncbi:MAG: hypothetical protein Q8R01_13530 [Ramlibacter sp.]|nr:hypothetical protein [Ramlibacter sp.]